LTPLLGGAGLPAGISPRLRAGVLELGSGFGLSIVQVGRHAFSFATTMPLGTALADIELGLAEIRE
jgi:hypothetical protein